MEDRLNHMTDKIARRINRHGMTIPAIMFLEMHKPLAGVGGAMIQFVAPGLDWVFGEDNTEDFATLLSDREQVERLISRIEELDRKKSEEVKTQC